MKRLYFHIILLLLTTACVNDNPTTFQATPATSTALPPAITPTATMAATLTAPPQLSHNRPLLLTHYMPWYQTQEVSGYWGWHWTMDHFDPKVGEDGRYEIASHYHPLIGPYDSRDDNVLEYHILLMKLSGIDGVLVDWYGSESFWDYGLINAGTTKLFKAIQEAGLLFAIVYEDQTVGHMVDNHHLDQSDALSHGQEVMLYLQDHWFQEEAYLKIEGQPLLLTFGPQFYEAATDWQTMFSVLEKPPLLVTLDNHGETFADATYPWPPMWASDNGVLLPETLADYLNSFYQHAESEKYLVAGAFPGFHDIYEEAGIGSSYGYLDPREGQTFAFTLQMALNHDPDVIQLITWNDYGEGTMIEPTIEFEYRYLEMIQEIQRNAINSDFPFAPEDLRLPVQLLKLRKLYEGDMTVNSRLNEAAEAILIDNLGQAKAILAEYPLDE